MALKVNIIKSAPELSEWKEYKDDETGEVLAEFKVRGIAYKPYNIAVDLARNEMSKSADDISKVEKNSRYRHEYMYSAMAHHLIEDWKGIELSFDDGQTYQLVPYTGENAEKLLTEGDLGLLVWGFVHQAALDIQKAANEAMDKTLGKSLNSTTGKRAVKATIKPSK